MTNLDDQANAELEKMRKAQEAKANGKDPASEESVKKSAATTLIEMAQAKYEFGVSATGETYAIPKEGPKLVAMLRGSKTSLRRQLARD